MTHLHPLSHVCVQYEKNPAKVSEISSGNEHAERPDMLLTISSPYFVGGDKTEEKAKNRTISSYACKNNLYLIGYLATLWGAVSKQH